uniref:Uncharacterized protein n=1 Tax=Rhipicephalus zambeziensis TaxID=60191 RepID=A0A224Y9A7_9ACAR
MTTLAFEWSPRLKCALFNLRYVRTKLLLAGALASSLPAHLWRFFVTFPHHLSRGTSNSSSAAFRHLITKRGDLFIYHRQKHHQCARG